jgi:iron complex outermembrane receptor protein
MNGKFYGATLYMAGLVGLGLLQLASGQAVQGQVAAESSDDLGEIVVTARRVEERAQDVPISMTIFTQTQLSDRNIVTATDLAAATPSVAVDNQFGNDLTSFSIRGFVQQLNTTPSVAVYFADAVLPRGGSVSEGGGSEGLAPGTLFDLQNVQVLKGPQGTLFGRNTDGGAVLVVPKKPTSDFEGYVQGGYGNYADGEVQGVLNVPLGDAVRVRLGVNHQTRDGFENNISGIGPSDFDNLNYTAARLSVVVDITPDIENYTIGSYNLSVNNGVLPQVFACAPAQLLSPLCPSFVKQLQAGGTYATANQFSGAESYLKQYQVVNTTTWRVSDNLTVKNVANYGLLKSLLDSSLFGAYGASNVGNPLITSTSDPTDAGGYTNDQYTWTDELQLSGNLFDNRLTWQAGGYVERSGPKGDVTGTRSAALVYCPNGRTVVNGTLADCAGLGITNLQTTQFHYSDQAVFGQATYAILPNLKATGGIRYTNDQTTALVNATDFAGYPATFPILPSPVATVAPGPSLASFCAATNGPVPPGGCRQDFIQNSHAPTYLLGLDYNPIQDVLLYAKYARGYRQGSVAPFTFTGYQLYQPEYVNSFEIGEKTTFAGPIPGTFDVTAHYNAFSDQQLLTGFIIENNPTSGIANAGKSRIWGVEVESTINPVKPLILGVSYAYLNTELESAFVSTAALPPNSSVFYATHQGNVLPFSPRNKLSANATYRLPVPDTIGSVSLGANVTYTSSELISEAAAPFDTLGAYGLLGANVHWDGILGSNIDAELFGTNLANRYYFNNLTQLYATSFGLAAGYPGEPRMYGLRVKIRFGGLGNK